MGKYFQELLVDHNNKQEEIESEKKEENNKIKKNYL